MKRLFTQFSFPGGIPSHVAPETPGSVHEGGELGYALSHAFGAAFDNPDLIVAASSRRRSRDRTARHRLARQQVLNPVRDGAVLPIPASQRLQDRQPCFLARIPKDELHKLFEGYGYEPYFVEGSDPAEVHQALAATLDLVVAEIRGIWNTARTRGFQGRPAWPMIVLRTPKGWTCPPEIDGKKCETTGAATRSRWAT